MIDAPPFKPVNGRVLVRQLPYKPSKIVEIVSGDYADETEGIVVAISDFRYGRKKGKKGTWEHTGNTFPHEVKVGDRVIFPGSYQDEDVQILNGVKHRCLDSWDIVGILQADQPDYYENAFSGERQPTDHPLLIK